MATLAFAALSKGDHGAHPASLANIGPFKAVYGKFTLNTDYPDGGYLAATLEGLAGLSPYIRSIVCIIPLGGAVTTDKFFPVAWDGTNRTLMVGGADGVEAATGLDAVDGTIVSCIVIGV